MSVLVDDVDQVVLNHKDIAPNADGQISVRIKHVTAAIEKVALAARTAAHAKGKQVDVSHTCCAMISATDTKIGAIICIHWGS